MLALQPADEIGPDWVGHHAAGCKDLRRTFTMPGGLLLKTMLF